MRFELQSFCKPVMKQLCLGCLILTLAAPLTLAQAVPKISTLSREWFQRGTTNRLSIRGEQLKPTSAIRVSGDSGVIVRLLPRPTSQSLVSIEASRGGIVAGRGDEETLLEAEVVVAPEASLNRRQLRAIAPTGASNPLDFYVSALPEWLENRSSSEAQELTLPVGISGVINSPGETDAYTFRAKADEDLVFDVLAFRSGSPLDSSLVLLDSGGKELARSEDAKGFDSFIQFHVRDEGNYRLELRDFRFEGSPAHKYHLSAGAFPCVDSVFPAGGRRGQPVELALKGVNLAGIQKLSLQPAGDAPLGWQQIWVRTPGGLSTPFPFDVSDLPEILESEPNDVKSQANAITVPGISNGRIGSPKDIDHFKFKSDKVQTLICEVTAQRFGSPLDAVLTLQDASGKVLLQNDDAEGADARFEYAFQKDQEYTLAVRDLLGRGGDAFVYRLSVRAPEPDFQVRYSPDAPRLHCGGRVPLQIELIRKGGFNGAVRITADELPPGISVEPLLITPESLPAGLLMVSAAGNASGGTYPLKLVTTGTAGGVRLTRTAEPILNERPANEGFLTVVEQPGLFSLDLLSLSVALDQNQSDTLEVALQRREGFVGEIKLTAEGFSARKEPPTPTIDSQSVTSKIGEARAVLKLKAKEDAEPGLRPLYVKGEAALDGQTNIQYSQAIPLTIRAIPFAVLNTMKRLSITVLPPGSKSAASEAEFAVRASRRGWFTDEISLALEGLPEGITATVTNLPSHVGEATFKLTATEKAPAGKEFKITVLGSANVAGRTYQQRTEPMTLSISSPQEMTGTD